MFYFPALSVENKRWYFLRREGEKEKQDGKKQWDRKKRPWHRRGNASTRTFGRMRKIHLEKYTETFIGENGVN